MRIYSFVVTIHVDRFSDLMLVVGGHPVTIEPLSVGEDNTIDVWITGEAVVSLRLDQCLQKIKHILSTAPVFEEI